MYRQRFRFIGQGVFPVFRSDKGVRFGHMEQRAHTPDRRIARDQQIVDLNNDITKHKETERVLRADAVYKDVLLQEISHRVMNGFHLISGMLQLQAQLSSDEGVKEQLHVASQRVSSMGLVHRRLYETADDITTVNAKTYLTGLCQELRDGFFSGRDDRILTLQADSDLNLPTEKMAFIGLAVSELVTNACKYAYKKDEPGNIIVVLKKVDDGYRLSVSDYGIGLPVGFDASKSKGLGMSIVRAQVSELHGILEIDTASTGTRFMVHIPE